MGHGSSDIMTHETILFVHGAGGDARIWDPVIGALPDWLESHAITLTYFGPAPWPDDGSGFGVSLHKDDIIAAAREIGQPVHLVCWSYAVQAGLAALIAEPSLFASALLYEGARPFHITNEADRTEFGKSAEMIFGVLARTLRTDGPAATIPALFGDHYAQMPEGRRAIYLSNARMMPLLFSSADPGKITCDDLAQITTPCCGAMGTASQAAFAISTKALVDAIPGSRLEIVEGADHFLPEIAPGRFAALVAEWVESLNPG
jgi:pimeloyl-ACP methyl ester carboxylesterase